MLNPQMEKKNVYEYAKIVAMVNRADEYGEQRWTFEEIKGNIWPLNPEIRGNMDEHLK